MWLLVAPRAAKVLMVMRASGSSRLILASAPRNGADRGPQPEATARKSGCRLTRNLLRRRTRVPGKSGCRLTRNLLRRRTRVPDHDLQADLEPRAAGDGLSQALGPPASSRQERGRGVGFQKEFPARLAAIAEETGRKPIELWFCDEARVGQKNKITRRWARRGTRPCAPRDLRTQSDRKSTR